MLKILIEYIRLKRFDQKFIILACILFFLSMGARMIYSASLKQILLYPDSMDYMRAAERLSKLKVDLARVPVYPMVIQFCKIVLGGWGKTAGVILFQMILSSFTVVLTFYIMGALFKSHVKAFTGSVYCAFSVALINWDFLILTESLTLFLLMLFLFSFILYVKHQGNRRILGLFAVSWLLILTKPFYLPLPLITFVVLLFYGVASRKVKQILWFGLPVLMIIYISVGVYSYINYRQNGFWGVSNVSAVNSLGKVLQYRMHELGDNKLLIDLINREIGENNGETPDPAGFIAKYPVYMENTGVISDFANGIIQRNPVRFIRETVKLVIRESNQWGICADYHSNNYSKEWVNKYYHRVNNIPMVSTFTFIYILLGIEGLALLVSTIKYRRLEWVWILIVLIIGFQFAMSIAGSHGEYSRLVIPVYIYIQLLFFKYLFMVFDGIWSLFNSTTPKSAL